MKQHNLAGLARIAAGSILYFLLLSLVVATKGETAEQVFYQHSGTDAELCAPLLRSGKRLLFPGRSRSACVGSSRHNRCQQPHVR